MDETTPEHLDKILNELSNFQKQFIESSKRFIEAGNKKLYTLDFFASAVNNRAISLTNAYVTLAKDNNYLTAVSLIRLQLDNALRFFASTLVADSNDFVMQFLDGKAIKDYTDVRGKKLSDNYLAKQLEAYFTGTQKLYTDTCGFIHLSDRHFFPTVAKFEKGNRNIGIQIGSYDNFKLDEKIDFSRTMLEVSKLVLIVVEQWKHEKEKLGALYDSQMPQAVLSK
jgi:hypothetical protein